MMQLLSMIQESEYLTISICHPGIEIPKWFNYQSEKSSIDVKLSPDWHGNNFLGFALCAVVAFGGCHLNFKYLNFYCELLFKTDNGERRGYFCWNFPNWENGELEQERTILCSDHVFMWFKHEDYDNCLDAVDVSFNFVLRDERGQLVDSIVCKVKRCGVRLLYLQDAMEFRNFFNNQYELRELEAISNEREATGIWRIDFTREDHEDDEPKSNDIVKYVVEEEKADEPGESGKYKSFHFFLFSFQ